MCPDRRVARRRRAQVARVSGRLVEEDRRLDRVGVRLEGLQVVLLALRLLVADVRAGAEREGVSTCRRSRTPPRPSREPADRRSPRTRGCRRSRPTAGTSLQDSQDGTGRRPDLRGQWPRAPPSPVQIARVGVRRRVEMRAHTSGSRRPSRGWPVGNSGVARPPETVPAIIDLEERSERLLPACANVVGRLEGGVAPASPCCEERRARQRTTVEARRDRGPA